MGLQAILNEQVKKITPSSEDIKSLMQEAESFIALLKKDLGLNAEIGGSLAKGTLLKGKGKQDVDIFIIFERNEDMEGLERKLVRLKLPGKLKLVHGSRDYFQVDTPQAILELIPVMKPKDLTHVENVTDFSLHHVKYVKEQLGKRPVLASEILLAKAFCKAQKVYGAESYIRGFSGYALEVLVIYYGGFIPFLKGIRKDRILDPVRHFKDKKEVLREINEAKILGPLILVDPTYCYRNVCAGLGHETFERFLEKAGAFLKKPSVDFFYVQPVDSKALKQEAQRLGVRFLEVVFSTDRQEGDIAGTKMRKLFEFLVDELKRRKQEVLRSEFDYSGQGQSAKGYLLVHEHKLVDIKGPLKDMDEPAHAFKKAKGDAAFVRGKHYWYQQHVNLEDIFSFAKRFEGDMGAKLVKIE